MTRQTLCVVDMQYDFGTANKCLKEVVREIKRFKKKNLPIIVLEYMDWGGEKYSDTFEEITSLLEGYTNVEYVGKENDGGGDEFIEAGRRRRFPVCNIRMVGVNRAFCVYSTAKDLKLRYGKRCKIDVVKKATWCSNPIYGINKLNGLDINLV